MMLSGKLSATVEPLEEGAATDATTTNEGAAADQRDARGERAGTDANDGGGEHKTELSPPPSPMNIRDIKESQFDGTRNVPPPKPSPRASEDAKIGKHGVKGMTATVAPTDLELTTPKISVDPLEAWKDEHHGSDNQSIGSSVASGQQKQRGGKRKAHGRRLAVETHADGGSVSSLDDLSRPASGRHAHKGRVRNSSAKSKASSEGSAEAKGVSRESDAAVGAAAGDAAVSPIAAEKRIVSELATVRQARAFVPLEVVTKKIASIVGDMTSMRQRHLEIVRGMEESFGDIETRTRSHYVAFVAALNEKHAAKAAALRAGLKQLAVEVRRRQGDADAATMSVRARSDELARENRDLLAKMQREHDEFKASTELRMADMSAQFDKERARITADAAGERSQANVAAGAEAESLKAALAESRAEIVRLSAALASGGGGVAASGGDGGRPTVRFADAEIERPPPVGETKIVEVYVPVPMASAPPPPLPPVGLSLEEAAKIEMEKKDLALRLEASRSDAESLRKAYEALEAQFRSVVAVVDAGGVAALAPAIDERIAAVEAPLEEARAAAQAKAEEVEGWEKAFRDEEGRAPRETDKALVRSIFDERDRMQKECERLEAEVTMLRNLAAGKGPVIAPAPQPPTADDAANALARVNEGLTARLAALAVENEKLRDIASSQPQGLDPEAVEAELRRSLDAQSQAYKAEIERLGVALAASSPQSASSASAASGSVVSAGDPEFRSRAAKAEAAVSAKAGEVSRLEQRVRELEEASLSALPVDAAAELRRAMERLSAVERDAAAVREAAAQKDAAIASLELQLDEAREEALLGGGGSGDGEGSTTADGMEMSMRVSSLEGRLKDALAERDALQTRMDEIEAAGGMSAAVLADIANDASAKDMIKRVQGEVAAAKKQTREDAQKIKSLTRDLRMAEVKATQAAQQAGAAVASSAGSSGGGGGGASSKDIMVMEKKLKDATKSLELHKARYEKTNKELEAANAALAKLQKEMRQLEEVAKKDHDEVERLTVAAASAVEALAKVQELQKELSALRKENQTLSENYKSEQTLRKKYYNVIEDMKGKIRVYCRERPMSQNEIKGGYKSVCAFPDEYTIVIDSQRGPKEFQFDQVFPHEASQEKVYEEVHNLIQSAVDGYNVCIFAYGQTGSGKTFTIVGPPHLPGIVPRAMDDIYATIEKNKHKFSFTVECYMLELYNDNLVDLLTTTPDKQVKLDIKKDAKGLVYVAGSVSRPARTRADMQAIFDEGTKKRHVSSTNMNSESSRSHLVFSVILESTNLQTGIVLKGKLSLVDLAGSERVGKTGATAERLKEAQSINKSLSALGDVISALSTGESFIPYRNNKLTLLMSDSLGGNAKTLMFVNISPADYNTDETVISLTYASRVKLITNDAQKNADNKEITRLKKIIEALKSGKSVEQAEMETAEAAG